MGQVLSFSYTPPARHDGEPWTKARLDEAPDAAGIPGAWTAGVDEWDLEPDPDPQVPQKRHLTTTSATQLAGWQRIVWLDAAGNEDLEQPISGPLRLNGLSLEELKTHVDRQLSASDPVLESLLDAAFVQAQQPPPYGCGRVLVPNPATDSDPAVAQTATVSCGRAIVPDARSISQVTIDGAAVTGYSEVRRNGLVVALEDLPDDGEAEITGRWGFPGLPADLRVSIYVLVAHHLHDRDSGYADRVVAGDGAAAAAYFRSLPMRTKATWSAYGAHVDPRGIA